MTDEFGEFDWNGGKHDVRQQPHETSGFDVQIFGIERLDLVVCGSARLLSPAASNDNIRRGKRNGLRKF